MRGSCTSPSSGKLIKIIIRLHCSVGQYDLYANTIIVLRALYDSGYKLTFLFCLLFLHSPIKDFNRQKLEEAIAALLVLPVPQNLLIQKSSLDKMPPNALPVDNLLIVSRFLGTLLLCVLWYSLFFFSVMLQYFGLTRNRIM